MLYKVQEIYPAVLDGKIHVAGGFLAAGNKIGGSTFYHIAYDPVTDTWEGKASLLSDRHHPNLVAHQGMLYALGGFKVKSAREVWSMQSQTWVYDPTADRWSEGPFAPERHGETVCASIGDLIHVVGGRGLKGTRNKSYGDHDDTDRHLVFDAVTAAWTNAAPALSKRNSAAGALIDGLFYVAGGRTVEGGNVADLEIYDPQEDKWRSGAPMPQAQGGLAAAALGDKLYAFGGEYFNDGGGVYPDSWVYDPATDQWQASSPMLTPRHGLGGVALDGWIYAIGGGEKASGNATSDKLERFRPA